jgi:3-oxoacyl-[acyl-carrier protein] reductase
VLAELPGAGHVLVQADLAGPDAVGRMVDDAATQLGGPGVLVGDAGVFTAHPPPDTGCEEWRAVWSRTLAVDCWARSTPRSGHCRT